MPTSRRLKIALFVTLVSVQGIFAQSSVAPTNDLPNPYATVGNPFQLPEGRTWGSISTVEPDVDGKSIWIVDRCGANSCVGSNLPVVMKFDPSGKLVTSFGAGLFVFPHGIHVDAEGNVWVVDGLPPGAGRAGAPPVKGGHHVVKFSPDGKVLLRLGMPGMTGSDAMHFNQPSDVITAPNGDIFVADGHGPWPVRSCSWRWPRADRCPRSPSSTPSSGPSRHEAAHARGAAEAGR
jgi:hypothetical protein